MEALDEINQQLRDSLAKVDIALNLIEDALVWCYPSGSILWCNNSFERLVGRSRIELIGLSAIEALPLERDGLTVDKAEHPAVLNGKDNSYSSFNFKNVDGDISSLEIKRKIGRQLKSKQAFHLLVIQDVTEFNLSKNALKKSNNFINALLEHIPDMIFVKDAKELKFVRLNKAGEELLGLSREELYGKSDFDFFSKSRADHFVSEDKKVLKSKKALEIPEETIETKGKGIRTLRTKKVAILNEVGEPEYLLGISEDVTERKKSEEVKANLLKEKLARQEAEKGVKVRDDFISIASHELRTPLTPLKMQIEFLPELLEGMDFPSKKEVLSLINKSQLQLNAFIQLVEKLLDTSRISSGQLSLTLKPVDLVEIVTDVIDRFEYEASMTGCPIQLKTEDEAKGRFDKTRIEQVITNLISNAIKFCSKNPIHVTLKKEKNMAFLCVRDQGIGIPEEKFESIFRLYERAVPSSSFSGLGTGLFTAKEVVAAHGGSIKVESKLGEGSTFTVTLPLRL